MCARVCNTRACGTVGSDQLYMTNHFGSTCASAHRVEANRNSLRLGNLLPSEDASQPSRLPLFVPFIASVVQY